MQTIGILTSGGDGPGMNAAIRAAARAALSMGLRPFGIRNGFSGLIRGDFQRLQHRSVTNIIQRGGTMLGTSRSSVFETPEGRKWAAEQMRAAGIEGLVAIGGEGTVRAAEAFYREHGTACVVVPATIVLGSLALLALSVAGLATADTVEGLLRKATQD